MSELSPQDRRPPNGRDWLAMMAYRRRAADLVISARGQAEMRVALRAELERAITELQLDAGSVAAVRLRESADATVARIVDWRLRKALAAGLAILDELSEQ